MLNVHIDKNKLISVLISILSTMNLYAQDCENLKDWDFEYDMCKKYKSYQNDLYGKRYGDLEDLALYKGLRLINKNDFKADEDGRYRPWEKYEPKPKTWIYWERGNKKVKEKLDGFKKNDNFNLTLKNLKSIHLSSVDDEMLKVWKETWWGKLAKHAKVMKVADPGELRNQSHTRPFFPINEEEAKYVKNYDIGENIKAEIVPYMSALSLGGKQLAYYPDGKHVKDMVENLLEEINQGVNNLKNGQQGKGPLPPEKGGIPPYGLSPYDFSAFIQKKYVSIHPFHEGSGRTSRYLQDLITGYLDLPPVPGGELQDDVTTPLDEYQKRTKDSVENIMTKLDKCLDLYPILKDDNIKNDELSEDDAKKEEKLLEEHPECVGTYISDNFTKTQVQNKHGEFTIEGSSRIDINGMIDNSKQLAYVPKNRKDGEAVPIEKTFLAKLNNDDQRNFFYKNLQLDNQIKKEIIEDDRKFNSLKINFPEQTFRSIGRYRQTWNNPQFCPINPTYTEMLKNTTSLLSDWYSVENSNICYCKEQFEQNDKTLVTYCYKKEDNEYKEITGEDIQYKCKKRKEAILRLFPLYENDLSEVSSLQDFRCALYTPDGDLLGALGNFEIGDCLKEDKRMTLVETNEGCKEVFNMVDPTSEEVKEISLNQFNLSCKDVLELRRYTYMGDATINIGMALKLGRYVAKEFEESLSKLPREELNGQTLYRGVPGKLNYKPGDTFKFNFILSTSRDSKKARNFAQGKGNDSGKNGTLILINDPTNISNGKSLEQFSLFNESEVIFHPNENEFKVKELNKDEMDKIKNELMLDNDLDILVIEAN